MSSTIHCGVCNQDITLNEAIEESPGSGYIICFNCNTVMQYEEVKGWVPVEDAETANTIRHYMKLVRAAQEHRANQARALYKALLN